MARLRSKARRALPGSAFAYPKTRKYPIHDRSHARNALSRAAQSKTSGSYAHVKRAVCKRYPDMAVCKASKRGKRTSRRRS